MRGNPFAKLVTYVLVYNQENDRVDVDWPLRATLKKLGIRPYINHAMIACMKEFARLNNPRYRFFPYLLYMLHLCLPGFVCVFLFWTYESFVSQSWVAGVSYLIGALAILGSRVRFSQSYINWGGEWQSTPLAYDRHVRQRVPTEVLSLEREIKAILPGTSLFVIEFVTHREGRVRASILFLKHETPFPESYYIAHWDDSCLEDESQP